MYAVAARHLVTLRAGHAVEGKRLGIMAPRVAIKVRRQIVEDLAQLHLFRRSSMLDCRR